MADRNGVLDGRRENALTQTAPDVPGAVVPGADLRWPNPNRIHAV
jgi:hypothetical protein